ncbi:hypothetical protein LTR39_003499 [Cryomyces antarcticus]|nr:hypothetical protein LTR39_003499 [Cryomyces antarcticus]
MLSPELSPSRRRTRAAVSVNAPKKSTLFIRDLYVDGEEHKDARDYDKGNLDEESPAPTDPVVNKASKHSSKATAKTEADVSEALP